MGCSRFTMLTSVATMGMLYTSLKTPKYCGIKDGMLETLYDQFSAATGVPSTKIGEYVFYQRPYWPGPEADTLAQKFEAWLDGEYSPGDGTPFAPFFGGMLAHDNDGEF